MTTINVAFSDSGESTIIAVMATPQPTANFPYQGEVPSSDARYQAFYMAQPFLQPMMPTPQAGS